jgi:hypothetical protein
MRMYILFISDSDTFLRLSFQCIPRGFAQFAVHLGQYEPGNLIFIQLLQEGALHRYIKKAN